MRLHQPSQGSRGSSGQKGHLCGRGGVPTLTRESRLNPREKALASAEQMLGETRWSGWEGPHLSGALGTLWENGIQEAPHFSDGALCLDRLSGPPEVLLLRRALGSLRSASLLTPRSRPPQPTTPARARPLAALPPAPRRPGVLQASTDGPQHVGLTDG